MGELQLLKNISISKEEGRAIIEIVEKELATYPQITIPIKAYFSEGVYAREMTLKAGMFITGAIHKFRNLNIISQGEVSIMSIDGVVRLKAPATFVASPGTKRMIYAHADTIWTTIHGTHETDEDKIEEIFIAKSYEDIL